MPTKKPRVQTILNEDIYEKFKTLCNKEMRTESQMASFIITSDTIDNQDQTYFSTIPITVKRNAYGRQLGSFHIIEEIKG